MIKHNTLYCHGWSSGPSVWQPLTGAASVPAPSFRRVVSQDGFLPAVMDSIPSTPHVVCGWSLGGMVALEYAAMQPEALKALVLVGTTPKFVASDRSKGWPSRVIRHMMSRLQEASDPVIKEFQAGMFSSSERPAFKRYRSLFASSEAIDFDHAALIAGLRYLIETDLTDVLKAVSCPVLWIHGTDDGICPSGCLDGLPSNHGIAMIEGAGHAPHWSRPDDVRVAVTEFMDDL